MVEAHHHHRTNEGRLTREHRSWSGCTAIDRNGCAKSPVRIFFHEEDSRLGGLWFGVPRTIETQRNCPGGVGRDTADLPCIVPASRMRGHRSVGQLRFPIASALASRSERSLCLARMEQRGQLSLPGDLSSTETPSPRVVIAHSARVCCTAVSEARSPEEEEEEKKRRGPRVSLIVLGSTAIHARAASMPRPMGISTSQCKHTPTSTSEPLSLLYLCSESLSISGSACRDVAIEH